MNNKKIRSPRPAPAALIPTFEHDLDVVESALNDLRARAQEYVGRARSPGTLRGYDSAWARFVGWCGVHRRDPLPADPEVVALFLADVARELHPTTLGRYTSAIKLRHDAAGYPSPTLDVRVKSVLRGIRRTHGVHPERQAAPLLVGDLISVVETLGTSKLIDVRDKALLLVGFGGAFRRSEIIGLDVRDLAFRSDGLVVKVRRSKTDQDGKGTVVGIGYGTNGTCPLVALRKWVAGARIESGPVFRGVDRHGNVAAARLNSQAVCRVIKKLVPRAGLDPAHYSGHSLRAGFATSAAAAGIEEREIAKVTRHASVQVLRRYIRDGQVLHGDLSRRLGL